MKALRTPLNTSHRLSEVNSRVGLDAGRVCLQLTGLGECLYSFQVFFDEIGGRGVRRPGPYAERARVQVGTAPLLIRAIALWPTMVACANCKRAGPRIELGCRCAVKTTPWRPSGPVHNLIAGGENPCICQVANFLADRVGPHCRVRTPGPLSCPWQSTLDAVGKAKAVCAY